MSADHPPQPPPAQDLAPIVYDELRRLAAAYMRRERPGQTLQARRSFTKPTCGLRAPAGPGTTSAISSASPRDRCGKSWSSALARAGRRSAGPGLDRVSMTDALAVAAEPATMLPALDDALTRLEQIDAEQARIVELRYFAGLSIEDTADALGMSPATLKRRWALARAWLFREMGGA